MLQASIVSVYISFLTASALAAFPAKESRYPVKNGTETRMVTEFVKCRNYDIFGISDEQMKISGLRLVGLKWGAFSLWSRIPLYYRVQIVVVLKLDNRLQIIYMKMLKMNHQWLKRNRNHFLY